MGEELQKEETLGGDGKKQQRVFRLALCLYCWLAGAEEKAASLVWGIIPVAGWKSPRQL